MSGTTQMDSNFLYSSKMMAQLKNVWDGMHIPSRSVSQSEYIFMLT